MTSDRANILIILVASVIITLPIALLGVPKGNDLPQHFQFAVVFRDSLSHGAPFPSWSANVNSGYGDVGVRFYPPLAYYLLVLFYGVFGMWIYATAVTICLLFFVGGVGVYLWCREWLGPRASLAGALLYVFVPYHVNEIYNAFTFAEFAAACVLPFCFLYVTRVVKGKSLFDCLGLAVSLVALLLTNLPMAVIGSISLTVYTLVLLIKDRRVASILRFFGSACFSLLLSAFYWVRMVSELPFVNHTAESFTAGDYDFRSNFVWSFFYSSADQYSERSLGFLDLMLLVTVAMAVAGVAAFHLRAVKTERAILTAPLLLLSIGLFFATPLSAPIWERIDLLQRTQFPWRWMAIISLACCMLTAAGFEQIRDLHTLGTQRLGLILGGLAAAAVTFSVAQVIRPAIFLEPASFDETVEALATANSCECWWPVWASKAAMTDRTLVAAGERVATIENWQSTRRTFQISAGDDTVARVATFYYPAWHARVNGQKVQISHDPDGAITVPLSREDSHIELYFEESGLERIANLLSIVAWFGLAAAATYFAIRTKLSKLI